MNSRLNQMCEEFFFKMNQIPDLLGSKAMLRPTPLIFIRQMVPYWVGHLMHCSCAIMQVWYLAIYLSMSISAG